MQWIIRSLNLGAARPFRDDGTQSAIAKVPTDQPVAIGPLGLSGDEQADLTVHGGPDKAIHHYPHDHYAAWPDELGDHPLLRGEGAFGENVSTLGLTEQAACIGDRYRLGTALIEISQGRQPCWKLDHRFGHKGLSAAVISTGRSGWYYRVIEPGSARAGEALELVERPRPAWTVARVFTLLVGGGHRKDPAALHALAAEALLAENWRHRATKLLG
jgi:MOSC domain-containing protein YiiM